MGLSVIIKNNTRLIQVPQTWEAAIVQLQKVCEFEQMSFKLLSYLKGNIDNINYQFGTDIDFRTIEDGRIILFSRSGKELIISEPLTRRVLFEKRK
jgi:hypothetical protein